VTDEMKKDSRTSSQSKGQSSKRIPLRDSRSVPISELRQRAISVNRAVSSLEKSQQIPKEILQLKISI
jgi:hypothetical protein